MGWYIGLCVVGRLILFVLGLYLPYKLVIDGYMHSNPVYYWHYGKKIVHSCTMYINIATSADAPTIMPL